MHLSLSGTDWLEMTSGNSEVSWCRLSYGLNVQYVHSFIDEFIDSLWEKTKNIITKLSNR